MMYHSLDRDLYRVYPFGIHTTNILIVMAKISIGHPRVVIPLYRYIKTSILACDSDTSPLRRPTEKTQALEAPGGRVMAAHLFSPLLMTWQVKLARYPDEE